MMSTTNRRGPNKPARWRKERITRRVSFSYQNPDMKMQKYDNPNERNVRAFELRQAGAKNVSKFSVSDAGHSKYFVVWE
jgi:hypothetical protein